MNKIDNRKDLLLLLLYSPGSEETINDPIIGRTRLMKAIYLFKNEVWRKFRENLQLTEENLYEFYPWSFGPFSSDVYNDLTFFILRGFIEVAYADNEEVLLESVEEWNHWNRNYNFKPDFGEDYVEEEFRLSQKGLDFTANIYNNLSGNQKKILKEFKNRISEMPLRALLRYVYKTYPQDTEKSIIKDDILKH